MIFRLTTVDSAGSTNDEVALAARAGEAEGYALFARQQTSGRGRQGRAWQSPPGNISLSFLLRPPPEKSTQLGQLAFVTALAVGEAVGSYGLDWRLKWPNDVYINGRKIAGILLEGESGWVVVGTGINVQHCPPVSDRPITSLRQEGIETQPEAVIERLFERFSHWYNIWQNIGFEPLRTLWLEHAYNLGSPVKVMLAGGQMAEGRFSSLDPDGALVLDKSDGTNQRILAGDVFFA